MIKSNRMNLGSLALLAVVALGGGLLGCSMGMAGMDHGDSQGSSEVRSGIDVGREGIQIAREGLASFHAGDRMVSLQLMGQGMEMISEGMANMHGGFDMMSGGMMSGGMMSGGMMSGGMMSGGMMDQCGCNGDQVMTPMHHAMEDMQQGHDMMTDNDLANDQMGAEKMGEGMDAMDAGYDEADRAMSCMDNAQGGMM
jgi:hypothetical protein